MSKRTERIVALERDAERFAGKASALHWEAAALVVEELDRGTPAPDLAKAIAKSLSWVRMAAKASRRWGAHPSADRPAWGAALQGFETTAEVAARGRLGLPKDPEERVALATKLLADPKVRKAVNAPSDRTIDVSGRKDPVESLEHALRNVGARQSWAEATAERLLDVAEDIEGREISASDRRLIQPAADRVATALLEGSIR